MKYQLLALICILNLTTACSLRVTGAEPRDPSPFELPPIKQVAGVTSISVTPQEYVGTWYGNLYLEGRISAATLTILSNATYQLRLTESHVIMTEHIVKEFFFNQYYLIEGVSKQLTKLKLLDVNYLELTDRDGTRSAFRR